MARERHCGIGLTGRSSGQPATDAGGQKAHQGTRTGVATQGQKPGRGGCPFGAVKKSRCDLQQGRGRLTGLEDRQALARGIQEARKNGARLKEAGAVVGISVRTLQRWQTPDGDIRPDGRPGAVRPVPAHALTAEERARLLAEVAGQWFFLYLIIDLYSSKIVGWEVHAENHSDHATRLVQKTALAEGIAALEAKPLLHGDNGSTLKATTVLAMLHWLGVKPSYSRPRVSDDNAFVESLFRNAKYRPEFPARGFADLEQARTWRRTSRIGPTTRTAIAASAMSLRHSATPAKIGRFSPLALRCTFGPGSKTRLAGRVLLATGIQ